ncbi:ATP-dependent Clp protease adapter ClpS [Gordonia sp. DT30]|uniref:ATP-dependent Clp protease adapter ClpS n=1 Tax=unclassified Gordonia (in: high G+C Gram-positive bacteria) TaxID=2657482 RepID=UPI003CEBD9BC
MAPDGMRAHEATPGGAAVAEPTVAEGASDLDRPWMTVVWDDPVNLMRYVTFVFQKIFGYSEAHANELMMQVHTEGRAVVSSGGRDKVEADVSKLHAAGLWATMQRDC